MKTITKIATVAMCACFGIGVFAGCGGSKNQVVVWGGAEDQVLLKQLIEDFQEENPDVKEKIVVRVQDPWNAQSVVDKDPKAAADVILCQNDHIGLMAKAGELAEIRDGTAATFKTDIQTQNDPNTVQQVTYNNALYGFPLTMDTCIMYYTTGIFDETKNVDEAFLSSVDAMLAADMPNIPGSSKEKAMAFGFNIQDGFYVNMGFFAVGCTLYGEDGTDVDACDWNSENGLKFMQYAAENFRQSGEKFKADDVKNLALAVLNNRLGACVSGAWEMKDTFKGAPNIKYRTLPSISVDLDGDGVKEQHPLVSFSNSKVYVVNNMSQHKATASRIAAYITSEKSQLRYAAERGYYPSNIAAQENDAVKNDPFFKVIRAQLDKSFPVPVIPEISNYWEAAKSLGTSVYNGSTKGDTESLQTALNNFIKQLHSAF